jgi:hypothetical protein
LTEPDLRRAVDALRTARLRAAQWDQVRRALDSDDRVELHRLAFEVRVQHRAGAAAKSPLAGKGSPGSLLAIGAVSTLVLVGAAVSLGGGWLLVPALIPAAMIAMVFAARWANNRRVLAARAEAHGSGAASAGITVPADVQARLDAMIASG